ncbi:MAG: glycoside hydrolase family 44 protein [Deltaproteobacteria bacterium]|nr:glycoside hydrolase family 44 protein [Deltaproteobacteria bacterium]
MTRPPQTFVAVIVAGLCLGSATGFIGCRDERPVLSLRDSDAGVLDGSASGELSVTVDVTKVVGEISPLIYGFHFPDSAPSDLDYDAIRPALLRVPGFRPTTYNWEINANNGGISWCNENGGAMSLDDTSAGLIDVGAAVATKLGATLVITVPIGDHVAADTKGGSGPPGCTGDVRKSPNYLTTRFIANLPAAPSPLGAAPNLTDAQVYQDQMVAWIKRKHPGLPVVFSLDRYPDRWSSFHPAVFAQPPSYDEICQRGIKFAAAIKSIASDAVVTGPDVSGWSGLVAGGALTERGTKGDFFEHYLRCMWAAQPAAPLLDVFEFAWVSEAVAGNEAVSGTGTSVDVIAARVQAPRSLWDPTYVEDSAPAQSEGALRLLPRLQEIIKKVDPQVGIFISEWSFGGTDHASGAVAVADALGVMGKWGVRMAALRWHQEPQRYSLGALRLFRNFDGKGAAFGSTAVLADATQIATVGAYASKDNRGSYILLINKTLEEQNLALTVRGLAQSTVWQVFRVGADSANPRREADFDGSARRIVLPALSVSLLYAPRP